MAQEDSFDGKRNRLVIPRLDGLFKARETGSSAGNTAVTRLWVFLKHSTASKRSRKVTRVEFGEELAMGKAVPPEKRGVFVTYRPADIIMTADIGCPCGVGRLLREAG